MIKQLAVESRDSSQAENKLTVDQAEEVERRQHSSLKMASFDHFE